VQTNVLYYGDNLDILRRYIPDESVDLVYLDPPFNVIHQSLTRGWRARGCSSRP
jgi:DNA modification methylase